MEVFITNLSSKTTTEQLQEQLVPLLKSSAIETYNVHKTVGKTHGFLTIADFAVALRFLQNVQKASCLSAVSIPGRQAMFQQSNKPPNTRLLQVLQKEQKDSRTRNAAQKIGRSKKIPAEKQKDEIPISSIECGRWETAAGGKDFVPYYTLSTQGMVSQQSRVLKIMLDHSPKFELGFDLHTIRSLATSKSLTGNYTFTVALNIAPSIYEHQTISEDCVFDIGPSKRIPRFRETKLPDCGQDTAGSCLAFRFTLRMPSTSSAHVKEQLQYLTSHRVHIVRQAAPAKCIDNRDFHTGVTLLNAVLTRLNWPFALRFQVQKLWANALMAPREIQELLSDMIALRARAGDDVLGSVLRRLCLQLQVADDHANGISHARLIMRQQETFLQHEPSITSQRHARDEMCIHSALVTPAGIYLDGPDEIAANRVLRQHRERQDHFLRVSFRDENEDRLPFDRDVSNERILQGRFSSILRQGLEIADEHFDFLGFSHSSLRSQTCWFMRPFLYDGRLLNARSLVSSLGDFSSIRCPAKCAARIGQAFSETTSAIKIDPSLVHKQVDIRAGDHVFTDGCGTLSKDMWKLLRGQHSRKDQPTLYQIRYKGDLVRHAIPNVLLTMHYRCQRNDLA